MAIARTISSVAMAISICADNGQQQFDGDFMQISAAAIAGGGASSVC